MSFLSLVVGIVIGALVYGLVIWIVGKLGLGLEVSGFGPAFIAAIAIAVIGWLVTWVLGMLGLTIDSGLWGSIVNLIVAAIILLVAGRFVKGLVVKGFVGALIAAIAIAVVTWLVFWFLGLFF